MWSKLQPTAVAKAAERYGLASFDMQKKRAHVLLLWQDPTSHGAARGFGKRLNELPIEGRPSKCYDVLRSHPRGGMPASVPPQSSPSSSHPMLPARPGHRGDVYTLIRIRLEGSTPHWSLGVPDPQSLRSSIPMAIPILHMTSYTHHPTPMILHSPSYTRDGRDPTRVEWVTYTDHSPSYTHDPTLTILHSPSYAHHPTLTILHSRPYTHHPGLHSPSYAHHPTLTILHSPSYTH